MNALTKIIITAALGVTMAANPQAPDTYVEPRHESYSEIITTESPAQPMQESEEATEPTQESDEATTEESVPDTEAKNSFTELYEIVMSHLSEILSLAAFIGSLLCAFIYKSGLLPLFDKGLGSIKSATQKIKEATDRAECNSKESLGSINGKILGLEDALYSIKNLITDLNDRLGSLGDQQAHQARIDTLLGGELDMLYDIFMSSSLPEYEKARVGERVTKLKKELSDEDK